MSQSIQWLGPVVRLSMSQKFLVQQKKFLINLWLVIYAAMPHIHSMPLYASAEDVDECGKLYGVAGAAYISCAYIRAQLCETDCQQLEKYNSSRIFFASLSFQELC